MGYFAGKSNEIIKKQIGVSKSNKPIYKDYFKIYCELCKKDFELELALSYICPDCKIEIKE